MDGERVLKPIDVDTIAALPEKLREALSMVAMGQDGWVAKSNLRALAKRGLIEPYDDVIPGRTGGTVIDRIPMHVTRYRVPMPVHIALAARYSTLSLEEPA